MTTVEPISYSAFLQSKSQLGGQSGFEPIWMPSGLKDFQSALVEWSVRMGRAAIFADCGLGKTFMQLAWAENVVRKSNRPVLILTPLAVAAQTVCEADKFGMHAEKSAGGSHSTAAIIVSNYEKLHHFNPSDFSGVVCDESSILKNMDGVRRDQITEFMRMMPYRLLCTATAAPNDFHEVGSSSDALGYLGARDMLTRFFKEDTIKDYLGWGRKAYRFRGHAQHPFWQWVCSWARACRKPSDLGFDDREFILPPLIEREVVVKDTPPREGMLFSIPASDMREQREERRVSIAERCETVAELVHAHPDSSVIWCHLNPEGDLLEKTVKDSRQVCGAMDDEEKEELFTAFSAGQLKRLICKPKIGCYGLNWQHCNNVVTFPSHSWEQYYQSVRRCYRFGQKKPVTVTVVSTQGEQGVSENLKRKARQSDEMFAALVTHMVESMKIDRDFKFTKNEEMPSWL